MLVEQLELMLLVVKYFEVFDCVSYRFVASWAVGLRLRNAVPG